jgi:hypothetical protein
MNKIEIDQPALVHYDTRDLAGVVDQVLRTRSGDVRQVIVRLYGGPDRVRFVPVQGSWKSLGGFSTLTV